MNCVQLVGNLTRDPELRQTQSGISACQFTIACQRRFKNKDGNYDADFISCVAWRQTAEFIAKYFKKGSRIGVTGSIQTRSYDAQDNSKRYVTEVVVDAAEFTAPAQGSAAQHAPAPAAGEFTEVDPGDELPF